MKYLAIKNMYLFKKNLFKYYYLNILVLLISLFQHHSILSYLREEEIFSVLGLGSLYENNPIYILFKNYKYIRRYSFYIQKYIL